MKRLVVVPSDPIVEYEKAGCEHLDRYYNPAGLRCFAFRHVFVCEKT